MARRSHLAQDIGRIAAVLQQAPGEDQPLRGWRRVLWVLLLQRLLDLPHCAVEGHLKAEAV